MKSPTLLAAALVLALIGATAGTLHHFKSGQRLGTPGVKTRPLPGSSNLEVCLPETLSGYKSEPVPQAPVVINQLPPDTSFGQRLYTGEDGFQAMVNVVLMGADRTSIHKPQICMVGQGWKFDDQATHIVSVPMTRPSAYDLSVMRVVATIDTVDKGGKPVKQAGVYVYWFVDASHLTAQHNEWKLWMLKDFLRTGVLDRWAYVTFFSLCVPGQEEATFERMKRLIITSVPEFQLVPVSVK
ncbi:MAG: exosortase-associated EpsI family protein [Verrucomicrobiota bacterium]